MNWFRRWWAWWRGERPARLVVVLVEGPRLALIDRYLDEGLLPHLALLSDVGQRIDVEDGWSSDAPAFCELLRGQRIQTRLILPPRLDADADLTAICSADRAQQERLMATLRGRRWQAVVAAFPMLAQIESLFGPTLDADQRLVIRDVYARMDEVVGKALSFVNTGTALLVVILPRRSAQCASIPAAVYVSRAIGEEGIGAGDLAEVVCRARDRLTNRSWGGACNGCTDYTRGEIARGA